MAFNEQLADRTREILASNPTLTEKRMFGGVCFLLGGNMVCGVSKDDLMLRMDAKRADELVERPHARPMDFTGRPMKGYLFVGSEGLKTEKQLREWLAPAVEYVQSLPPKKEKAKRKASKTSSQKPA